MAMAVLYIFEIVYEKENEVEGIYCLLHTRKWNKARTDYERKRG